MHPLFQSGDVAAHRIDDAEAERFQPLLERCEDFFRLCYGRPARADEARRLTLERPPGVTPEQGHLLALVDSTGAWVGIFEGLRDFPTRREAYLGLLLLEPGTRGRGLGAGLLAGYEDWLRASGQHVLRVGVAEPNPAALRFWTREGFQPETWVGPMALGELSYRVLRMRKTLTAPAATP
ncbi:GNAT family N-acetyltransferase [Myxococcus sp. AB025B]|uniref:GNAT family N-acetyltransferase n=1 Tax=Myxococcus sp. AB025B TaxID=2562794 RepID=UPI001141D18E|nr:GNAT family N-acetyltransferase [Myxococcus sp. AB025B]